MDNLIKAVRDHAIANYEKDGWDVLVECWEDDDIVDAMRGARTAKTAIARVGKAVKEYHAYANDIQATAF